MTNLISHAVTGKRLEAIPVKDPALRLMVFSHLSRLRDARERQASAKADACPIEWIRSLSVSQLTRLVSTMHAPTIAIRMKHACRGLPPFETGSPSREPLTYVLCEDADTTDEHGTQELIPADDPLLRVMLLSHLARESFDSSPQADTPIDEEALDSLMRRIPCTANDPQATGSSSQIEIRIDLARLNCDVNRYQHLSVDEAQFNYFIKAEASVSMMTELFKVSAAAVRKAQLQSGIKTRVGRKCMPDEDTCLCVLEAWRLICQELAFPRDRFQRLHQRFSQFSIAQLYAVVNSTCRLS